MTTTISLSNSTIGASITHTISDADTQRWANALIATQEGYASDTPAQAVARAFRSWLQDQVAIVQFFEMPPPPAPITVA